SSRLSVGSRFSGPLPFSAPSSGWQYGAAVHLLTHHMRRAHSPTTSISFSCQAKGEHKYFFILLLESPYSQMRLLFRELLIPWLRIAPQQLPVRFRDTTTEPGRLDTRSLQLYLGHKNIQHTTRYTELAADRCKDFSDYQLSSAKK